MRQPEAPSTTAASSSLRPWCCISGMSERATKGSVTKMVASTMPGAATMSAQRTAFPSGAMASPRPALEEVDREQGQEGNDEHRRGERGRPLVVKLFEPRDDEERRDLGIARQIAGDEDDRAVFPDAAR